MTKLKLISKKAIPAAIKKANHYRLLNEPGEAESICLDILLTEPNNQQALIILVLALTDRFDKSYDIGDSVAEDILPRIRSKYNRAYYSGIMCERRAKAALRQSSPGAKFAAHDWLQQAMDHYQDAEKLRPAGNDDAVLRWNTCARIIEHNHLTPHHAGEEESQLE